ncbi:MAG: LTA synthase family protein, partial [Planctomycetota bacterium]
MKRSLDLARLAWIVAAHFVVFSGSRLALFWIWRTSFEELSTAEVLRAASRGLVFDASIITLGLSPLVVAFVLPFEFARARRWRTAWSWYGFAHLCLVLLLLAGDVAYFGNVGRHAGLEIVVMLDDPALINSIVWESYRLAFCGTLLGLVLLGALWRRVMSWDERWTVLRAPSWAAVAFVPLLFFGIRGNASGKPISVVDAFASGSVSAGYLTLNGPFSIARAILHQDQRTAEFMPWTTAVENVQAQLFSEEERAIDPGFPLLRARASNQASRPNVVVLLLESWDGDVVDALRKEAGKELLGLTPNFDALSHEGVLFSSFYAAGQRSTHGLLAVLCGLPTLPGMPYLGRGVEQSRLSYLGRMAMAEGYATHFLQGSKERSFRIDSIAALAGFEHYLGRDGIAAATGHEPMAEWGAWDADLLASAHAQFAAAQQPFLGFAFTTSTHLPFQVPEGHPSPYPDDTPEHSYWNSVHYADSAIGTFFAAARKSGYFDNTVFVLVSDHRSGIGIGGKSAAEMHHIPCLVIAPGLAARVDPAVASQLDLLPSIVDLAHWTTPYAALGRSLFDTSPPSSRGALCVRNEIVVRVEESGWISHDLQRRLDTSFAGFGPG